MNLPDMLEDIPHKVVGDAFYFPKMDNYFFTMVQAYLHLIYEDLVRVSYMH